MAKKKDNKQSPIDILDMMYQKGYRAGYADGIAKGKQLVFGWLQDIKNGKSIDQIVKESNGKG
jgi:hypothetical protein